MYCIRCGKQTDTTYTLCDECKAKEPSFAEENIISGEVVEDKSQSAENEAKINAQRSKERKTGLVKAIILNVIAVFQAYAFLFSLMFVVMAMAMEMEGLVGVSFGFMSFGELLFLSVVAFTVYAVIEGIKFVKLFVRHCKEKKGKPIATFVLGLSLLEFAFAMALCSILYGFIFAIAPFTFLVG